MTRVHEILVRFGFLLLLLGSAAALAAVGCGGGGDGDGDADGDSDGDADGDGDGDADGDSDGDADGDGDGDADGDADGDGDGDVEPWIWVELEPRLVDGAVIDPKLGGEPTLRVEIDVVDAEVAALLDSSCLLDVEVIGASGQLAILAEGASWIDGEEPLTFSWDGRDEEGLAFDPGPAQIAADIYCSERLQGWGDAAAHVVRLGVVAVDFVGETVPLAYHKLDLFRYGLTLLDGATPELLNDRESAADMADLDRNDGAPRAAPTPWLDPDVPPWGDGSPGAVGLGRHNVPAGYVAAETVELDVTFGERAVSSVMGVAVPAAGYEGLSTGTPPIRVVVDGFESRSEEALWAPGATVELRATAPLSYEVGRHELLLSWRFEAQDVESGEWVPIPGAVETEHQIYQLAGQPRVPDGSAIEASPTVAWIGVLDEVDEAISGLSAEVWPAIMTALREMVHNDPWVIYNPGDGSYSAFEGDYLEWDSIWVEMSDWLDRRQGIDLYCHSMACLLSSLGNHVGLDAQYLTLGRDFETHLTRAAGGSEWRTWRFNSHGIVTLAETGLVWDAAVDFDGDANPDDEPVVAVQPNAVPLADYFTLLTDDEIEVLLNGYCFVY